MDLREADWMTNNEATKFSIIVNNKNQLREQSKKVKFLTTNKN